MLELAQQLSMYLSVVDGGATSKLVSYGQQIASVGVLAQTAMATVNQVLAPAQAVAAAWSARETQINNIARTLRQYEYVGQSIADINRDIARSMPDGSSAQRAAEFTRVYNTQFQSGRQAARGLMQEMNQMAALLPGEASDYMQAFSTNLPFLSGAKDMTTGRASRLAAYLTAGGIAGGVDAGQSSRDLMQFLTTGPHMTDRSWVEVWSQYATYRGKKVDANRIRSMTRDQRVEVLENIAGQLQPMMDAMGDSFEAVMGTFKSFKHELYLQATEPIFESFKKMVDAVNKKLVPLAPLLGTIGAFFGGKIAAQMDKVTASFDRIMAGSTRLANKFVQILPMINSYAQGALGLVRNFGGGAARLGRGAYGLIRGEMAEHGIGAGSLLGVGLGVKVMQAFGVVGFLPRLIIGSLVRMFTEGMGGSTLAALVGAIQLVLPPLMQFGMTLFRVWDALTLIGAMILSVLLPPLITLAGVIIGPLLSGFEFLLRFLLNIFASVLIAPLFLLMGVFMGVYVVVEIVVRILQVLASLFGALSVSSFDFIDALRQTADFLVEWMNEVQEGLNYLLHDWGLMSDAEYTAAQARIHAPPPALPEWMTELQSTIRNMSTQSGDPNARGRAPPQPRPHTNQDFRYSRFDITQKFAEGFDPDRVASAMASELSAMSEQQLQSGFQPAFTTV